jgi:transposase
MRVHRNAKTTPKMRLSIGTRAQQGWTYARIAEALGISVRTVAKWVSRGQQRQELADGSSRPHRQPRRTAPALAQAMVALRRRRLTAWQISTALRQPRSTVTRVLARAGLNRLAWLEPSIYRRVLELRVIPAIGAIRVQELKALNLKRYYTESSLGASTLAQHHAIIHGALKLRCSRAW